MAYQNFFGVMDNGKRMTPVQVSGKHVTNEFRMRSDRRSIKVCDIIGEELPNGQISTTIIVYDGNGVETARHTIVTNK